MCIHLLLQEHQNCNELLNNYQHRRMLDPTKKDTLCPRAKRSPNNTIQRGAIMFKTKAQTRQRCSDGVNKTLCAPGLRERSSDPHKRLSKIGLCVSECPCRGRVSGDLLWGQELQLKQTQEVMWHNSSWRRSQLASLQSHQADNTQTREQLYQSSHTGAKVLGPTADFPTWRSSKRTENTQGNRLLEGTPKSCTHQDSGERSNGPTRA